jgi:NAD-dependent SIR2 family protein deacetylase
MSSTDAQAVTPCVTKDFKTELAKNACAKGGQPAAKDAMKKFMKEAKIKTCNACHTKLAPKYELKTDGLDQFKKAGGK